MKNRTVFEEKKRNKLTNKQIKIECMKRERNFFKDLDEKGFKKWMKDMKEREGEFF